MPAKLPAVALILLLCSASVTAHGGEALQYAESVAEEQDAEEPSGELLEFLGEWEVRGAEWIDPVILERLMEPDYEGGEYDNREK